MMDTITPIPVRNIPTILAVGSLIRTSENFMQRKTHIPVRKTADNKTVIFLLLI
jgi:hypothetical protein